MTHPMAEPWMSQDQKDAVAMLRVLVTHLLDHGSIELGTPQSQMLVRAALNFGAFAGEDGNFDYPDPKEKP